MGGMVGDAGSSLGASSAGVGSESGNANSTTQAGISGLVGNTAVRTSDAETGLTPIFNKDKVKTEVGDQVAASAASFSAAAAPLQPPPKATAHIVLATSRPAVTR